MSPVRKSCFRAGCEWHDRCKLYKAEMAPLQVYPQHSGEHCDFFAPHGPNDREVETND
jgi:hypothetical protein